MKNMNVGIAFVIVLFCSLSSYAGITLKAYDENGHSATTFNVGMPLTLEVALQDMPDVKERPTVKGLQATYARDSSMMTMSINGKTTIKYSYKVRFDAVGIYEVGPATVERNGQLYSSNKVTIKIVEQPIEADIKDKNKSSLLFVRMKVDKDRVMVGEKFKCILRCYYTDQVRQASPSSAMQLPGFVFEDGVQQANGVESIKGVNYNYFELCWNGHATEAGKKTIPAFCIDYIANTNPYGSHASAIAMMFGHSFGEQKRAYSNAVQMSVDALPAHASPVHAIGTFSRFSAHLEPAIATQGEGMVLTLEIVGQGTFDKDNGIELQNMPAQLKYYDSKQYDDKGNSSKKYFEFIVQGLERGEWQVPRQQFTFFDTKARMYKTLQTDAIGVKIISHAVAPHAIKHSPAPPQSVPNAIDATDDIKPLLFQEDTMSRTVPSLPLWMILILVIFPLGLLGYEKVKNSTGVFDRINRRSRKNNAFNKARTAVKDIFARHHTASLYTVFVQLFANRCSVDEHAVNQEFMYQRLKKSGMHQQELEQWHEFYNQLSELMFFNKQIKPNESIVMQQYAYRWIDRLEKLL